MIPKKRINIALMCQVLAFGILCCSSPKGTTKQRSRVRLWGDSREVTLTFEDGRPCDFNQGNRFNLLGMGTKVISSPNGKYAAVVAGLKRGAEELEPPVLRCWPTRPDLPCGVVVLVIDLETCHVVRTIKVGPGRQASELAASFDGSDSLLAVRFDFVTDFYSAPGFTRRFTVPFNATVLGELPGARLLTLGKFSRGSGTQRWYYVVAVTRGQRMTEIARRPTEEWGDRLVGDWDAPGGGWQALYADDQVFAVLYPAVSGKTGAKPPTVEAYRLSGGPPAVKELPPDAGDIRVTRDATGRLVCSFSVHSKSVTSPLTFPKAARRGYCDACRRLPQEATHWIDGRGNLVRLSDRQTCSLNRYTRRGDGQRYDFLPYPRDTYVWASPRGSYIALAGALKPRQNPETPARVDRPNYFGRGFDSVLAVIDLDACRIVRFMSILPGETEHREPRFTPDDELLFAGRKVYAAPDFHEANVLGGDMLGQPSSFTPVDMYAPARKDAAVYGLGERYRGYGLLRREKSRCEAGLIPYYLFPSPLWRYVPHLLYASKDRAALLFCDRQSELVGGAPAAVEVFNFRSKKLEAGLKLPHDARKISVATEKGGTLVCSYMEAGRKVVKPLTALPPTPAPTPLQADG